MTKREISAKIISKPIGFFDLVNNSARFKQELQGFFGAAPRFPHRMRLHETISSLCQGEPIDYLEFGVWQGESFLKWLDMNKHADSRFYGFDSFEGLPEDWDKGRNKGFFSTGGQKPQTDDPRGSFVVGWFQDTLYPFLSTLRTGYRKVIHVDCDLYSSSLYVLTSLDRHLEPGDFIIFDDFHSLQDEFAAWLDYRASFNRRWEPLGIVQDGQQAAVRLIG